jgi:crossover junction endodeoxyribonuclease RuvC
LQRTGGRHNGRVGVTLRQFHRMQNRLSTKSPALPVFEARPRALAQAQQVILGIDPSLRGTGYGIIRLARLTPQTLVHGTISCPEGWARSRCLLHIQQMLRRLLKQYHPAICVVEGLFYAQNLKTALIMGEARGVALATVAEADLEIYEVAPRKVKQAVVGYGAAQKVAVAKMVQRLLNLPTPPAPDAADALALALTFAQEQGRYSLAPPKRI